MRKKILIISPYFPYPPFDGGKNRIFNLIKQLSSGNDICLLSFVEPGYPRSNVDEMKKICKSVYAVERDESAGIQGDDIPRSVSFYYTPAMIAMLEKALKEFDPDVVQIEFLVMTRYAVHIKNHPMVYTEHDISNIDFDQSFHDRDLPGHLRYIEWHRLVKYEKKILGMFDSVIVLTERDRQTLKDFSPATVPVLAPTGVDTGYYSPAVDAKRGKNMVFVGHYRHYPNYDAFKYFIEELLPEILKKSPDAKFYAVGSAVTPDMAEYASENVIITGEVKDIRPFLEEASVFIAPVRLGGGIKGKILEAMASGVPVVATVEAAAGIACTDGVDILVSKDKREFVDNTVELLGGGERSRKLATNARALVERYYDWKSIAGKLDMFYDKFV